MRNSSFIIRANHRASKKMIFLRSVRQPVRMALTLCLSLLLLATFSPPSSADKPITKALVTDKANLPLSNQFAIPGQVRLTETGDVFFTPGPSALFQWASSSGLRTRLLQGSDPYPGFPGSVTDIVGNSLRVNAAGHAAMLNFFVRKGERLPRGVFVYDGAGFQKVALRDEVAPGTGGQSFLNFGPIFLNDSDEVAFLATFEPLGLGTGGIFIGSPTGPPNKIAVIGETAPGTGGGTYLNLQLLGFNNAGEVAFHSNIAGGTTPFAVFIGTTSGVSKVAATGETAPDTTGAFNLLPGAANYALNSSGDLAFVSNVAGGAPVNRGIWIGNSVAAPSKLVTNADATPLGGTYGGAIALRGFGNTGKALFQSNPVGASSSHALFLNDLAGPAQVVLARGDAAGGGVETFDTTQVATLNQNDKVAFLASLQGGAAFGWFLGSGSAAAVKIALQGEPSPAGGAFGLGGRIGPAQINGSDQVAFVADILGPNAVGAFLWTPGSGSVSIVNTNDVLPAGANTIIRTFQPGASDDRLLFHAFKAGGRFAVFTKPLQAGGGGITRLFGDGDAVPSIGGALWNIPLNFGVINDNEEVPTLGSIIGGPIYPANGLFIHQPGAGLQKLAATGDPAPDAAGSPDGAFQNIMFNNAPPARINASGQVAFFANIAGSAGNASPRGIFIGSLSGGVQAVARIGDLSPIGGNFVNLGPGGNSTSNDAGQVAFVADTQMGMTQTRGLFVGSGNSAPVKVVAQGDAGPGGSTFNILPLIFQMNNGGQVAYMAGLTGGASPEGLFLGTAGGAQQVVALVGDPASGTGGGTFSDFEEADIELNNAGQVAFWSRVTGPGAGSGYFLGSATAAPAARLVEGQALPGGGAAGFVSPGINNFIGEQFSLTDAGEMSLYVINVTSAPDLSRQVIASPTGVLREFATSGEKAPGTGSSFGALFQSVGTNSAGRFFLGAILVEGPARWGIFTDK